MGSPSRKATTSFIFVTLFLDVLGLGLVIPITPGLMKEYLPNSHYQSEAYGAFIAAYSLALFLASPFLGALSDSIGRRPTILLALVGSAIDYLLMAAAPNVWFLFLGRAIGGVTGASAASVAAYIADVTPPEKRAQSYGTMGMIFGVGFIVGPLFGGLLGHVGVNYGGGLRLPLYVAAGLTAANALYGAFVLPESLALKNRKPFKWSSANPFATIPGLRRFPAVFGLVAALLVRQLGEYGVHATWVLYTGHKFGWGSRENGISLAFVGIVIAVVQGGVVRRFVPRFGEKRAVFVGHCVLLTGYVLYGIAPSGWLMYAIIVLSGLGEMAGPTTFALITRHVPSNEHGTVQGAITSLGSITGILAPAIAASIFGFFTSPGAPVHFPGASFLSSALFVLVALILVMRSLAEHPLPPKEEEPSATPSEPPGEVGGEGATEPQASPSET
jgi:DHA1 family tetracycline resistance protein-like MFS transporter